MQDTIIKPYRIVYRNPPTNIDTSAILKSCFAQRTYRDTIKTHDVTAVITDSITGDSITGRKVWIENSRDTHLAQISARPVNKLFIGGFIGLSQTGFQPSAGLSLTLDTKKDALFQYGFDLITRTHTIGMSWKIHF